MRRRSLMAVMALVLSLGAGRAEAVTVRDVIELSKAGLSDSVLLALIGVDRSVFSIDTATLKELKSAGVSDAVIVAMIKSGRETLVENPMPPIAQQPVAEPDTQSEPDSASEPPQSAAVPPQAIPYPVAVPVPVYIAVPATARHRSIALGGGPPIVGSSVIQIAQPGLASNCRPAQVPNWGFGGTIRQLPPLCR